MPGKSGSKKQVVFLWVFVFIAVLFIGGFLSLSARKGRKIVVSGDPAPEFRLPEQDGRIVSLSDFKGKVVMVHFWATWCPPCVAEIPTLDRLSREIGGKDFVLLAVSVNEGGIEEVAPFMRKHGLSLPVLFDSDRKVSALYGTFKFPETYIVGRRGIVRYKAIGPRDWTDPRNVKIIRDIMEMN
jgi:peroxiredoxin